MTTPYFQIALNKDLEQDDSRRKKAMKVLKEMMSEEAQKSNYCGWSGYVKLQSECGFSSY